MKSKCKALGSFVVLLCGLQAIPQHVKSQRIATRDPKSASTPEEAIKYLADASKDGDLQAYISCLAEPFRGMRKTLVEVIDAQKIFFEALDEKFGKATGPQQHSAINDTKRTYLDMKIKGPPEVTSKKKKDDGTVLLEIRVLEKGDDGTNVSEVEKFTARKEGTSWKLAPWEKVKLGRDTKFNEPNTKFDGFLKLLLGKQKKAIIEITEKVNGGKFKSRREVQIALQTAMQAIEKELATEKENALGKPPDAEFKPIGKDILKKIKPRKDYPAKAIAMIEERGGKYVVDKNDPEQPVIEVILQGTDADNGDLALLREFPKLQKLNLASCTKINNVGLEWLEDLKELRVLRLNSCSHVSDSGMEFVGKLTNLEELYLDETIVTDLGLKELKGLKNLKKLSLNDTLADGRGLKSSIPSLKIIKN